MASDAASVSPAELYESTMTVPSDSENYSANHEMSSSTHSASSSPVILYKPPSVWGLLRGAAINLFLPFVNGLMLGFGELFAHEAAFRLGWSNTKVCGKLKLTSFTMIADVFPPDFPQLPPVTPCRPRCRDARAALGAQTTWTEGHCLPGINF